MMRACCSTSSRAFACKARYEMSAATAKPTANIASSTRLNFQISFTFFPVISYSIPKASATCARSRVAFPSALPALWPPPAAATARQWAAPRPIPRRGWPCCRARSRSAKRRIRKLGLEPLDEDRPVRPAQPRLRVRVGGFAIGRQLDSPRLVLTRAHRQRIHEIAWKCGDEWLWRACRHHKRLAGRARRETAILDVARRPFGQQFAGFGNLGDAGFDKNLHRVRRDVGHRRGVGGGDATGRHAQAKPRRGRFGGELDPASRDHKFCQCRRLARAWRYRHCIQRPGADQAHRAAIHQFKLELPGLRCIDHVAVPHGATFDQFVPRSAAKHPCLAVHERDDPDIRAKTRHGSQKNATADQKPTILHFGVLQTDERHRGAVEAILGRGTVQVNVNTPRHIVRKLARRSCLILTKNR